MNAERTSDSSLREREHSGLIVLDEETRHRVLIRHQHRIDRHEAASLTERQTDGLHEVADRPVVKMVQHGGDNDVEGREGELQLNGSSGVRVTGIGGAPEDPRKRQRYGLSGRALIARSLALSSSALVAAALAAERSLGISLESAAVTKPFSTGCPNASGCR